MVRFAVPDDSGAIAAVHVDAWRACYAGIVPAPVLDGLSTSERAERWRRSIVADPRGVLLYRDDDGTAGWVALGPCRDQPPCGEGEIFAIYIKPGSWRRGIGTALMDAAEEELRTRGFRRFCLWVLESNELARRFYSKLGYRPDGKTKAVTFGEAALTEVRYEKQDRA